MSRSSVLAILAAIGIAYAGPLTSDTVAFARAVTSDDVASLQDFVAKYPESKFAPHAMQMAKSESKKNSKKSDGKKSDSKKDKGKKTPYGG